MGVDHVSIVYMTCYKGFPLRMKPGPQLMPHGFDWGWRRAQGEFACAVPTNEWLNRQAPLLDSPREGAYQTSRGMILSAT